MNGEKMNNYYQIQYIQQNEFQAYKERLEDLKKTIQCAEKHAALTQKMRQALSSGDVNVCQNVLQNEIQKYRDFIIKSKNFFGVEIVDCSAEQSKANGLLYYQKQFHILSNIILGKIIYDAANESCLEKALEKVSER